MTGNRRRSRPRYLLLGCSLRPRRGPASRSLLVFLIKADETVEGQGSGRAAGAGSRCRFSACGLFVLERTVPISEHAESENLWRFRGFRYFFLHLQACRLLCPELREPSSDSIRTNRPRRRLKGGEEPRCRRGPGLGAPRRCARSPAQRSAGAGRRGGRRRWVPAGASPSPALPRISSIRQLGMPGRERDGGGGGVIR